MSEVFISYARANREQAARIAECLNEHGLSVWWDFELVPGNNFISEIERQIGDARVVIVLWSTASVSVDRRYVREEVLEAERQHKLLPITIDGAEPPFGFRQYHTHALTGWNGNRDDDSFKTLLAHIQRRLGGGAEAIDDLPATDDSTRDDDAADAAPVADTDAETDPVDTPASPEPKLTGADDAILALLRENLEEEVRDAADPDADVGVLTAVLHLADRLQTSGDGDSALAQYERAEAIASALGSEDWTLRVDRGVAHALAALERHDEAADKLRDVARSSSDPTDTQSAVMATIQALEVALEEARYEDAFRHVDTLDPERGSLWLLRSRDEIWTPELIEYARPPYVRALAELASGARAAGQAHDALEGFERYLAIAPEYSAEGEAAIEDLGHVYMILGDQRQAPGRDTANLEALGLYELAEEIFSATRSALGLRGALRRSAQIALAGGDVDRFGELRRRRDEVGRELPNRAAPEEALTRMPWPVHALRGISADVIGPNEVGAAVEVAVTLENYGGLTWRAGRKMRVEMGTRSANFSSSITGTLTSSEPIRPGETGTATVRIAQNLRLGRENLADKAPTGDAFVRQVPPAPWAIGWEVEAPLS